MKESIDITPEQYSLILDLIRRYLPDTGVWVYGSRAGGTARITFTSCSGIERAGLVKGIGGLYPPLGFHCGRFYNQP